MQQSEYNNFVFFVCPYSVEHLYLQVNLGIHSIPTIFKSFKLANLTNNKIGF